MKQLHLSIVLFFIVESVPQDPFPFGLDDRPDPFSSNAGLKQREHSQKRSDHHRYYRPKEYNQHNTWGFDDEENVPKQKETSQAQLERIASKPRPAPVPPTVDPAEDLKSAVRDAQLGITTTDLPPDPKHNGLLKDVGTIGVGFGVGVGVPGNDPVSVGTGVSIGLGESGPAGGLPPFTETIFPRQGEQISLNDYDGNKDLIVSGKALKYIQAVRLGFIQLPKYAPQKSLVGVNSGIGILGAQAPTGG